MGKYLAMLSATCEKSELSEQRYSFGCSGSNQHNQAKELFRLSRLFRNLAELERHIPEHVSYHFHSGLNSKGAGLPEERKWRAVFLGGSM